MEHPRVWLITGASTGFGRALAELLLHKGEIVVATARTPSTLDVLRETYPPDQLLVLKCDVSNSQDIKDIFRRTIEQFGRCDVVFNNAGYGVQAEIEGTPNDVARALFEVNFWGAALVSTEAVRVFRDINPDGVGGRLLNVSSISGATAVPSTGYYVARYASDSFLTGFEALEGLTGTLAQELDPEWNIKVSIIAPGGFRTRAAANSLKLPVHDAYQNPNLPSHQFRALFATLQDTTGGSDPKRAVEKIFEFSKLENPPMRWALGMDSVALMRTQAQRLLKETDDFAAWSEGLEEK